MARKKIIPDETVLKAALAIMARDGADALTFASLGKAAGLSPATLVQRHGNRSSLMRAALLHAWDDLDARTAEADALQPETPEGAIALLVSLSGDTPEIEDYAGGLLLLREDMRDPALRDRGAAWGRALARALGRRLSVDPARQQVLGRLIASQWQGAQIWWGFSREESLAAAVAADLRDWCTATLARAARQE